MPLGTRAKLGIRTNFPSSVGPFTLQYPGGSAGLAMTSSNKGGGPSARGADIEGFNEGACCCALTTHHEALTTSVATVKRFFIGYPSSLCNLSVLCVSVVVCELVNHRGTENTEVAQ